MEQTTNADANAAERQEISSISDGSMLSSPDYSISETNTVVDAKGEATDGETNTATDDDGKGEDGDAARFDKHPRFQQLMKERDEAREKAARVEGQLEAFSKLVPPQDQKAEELPFKDISSMSPDELREWQEDDPVGYSKNLVEMAKWNISQDAKKGIEQNEQQSLMKSIEQTFTKYETENPSFTTMWNDGSISKFMQENPGHNAISAHMHLTSQDREKAIAQKAAKEAEQKVIRNFMAKRGASGLTGGPAHIIGGDSPPPELQNTKTQGGRTAVIASRLAAIRNQ